MFAVIKTGGKQYRVCPDDILNIEKLDLVAGENVRFDEVLMIGGDKETIVGTPLIEGARVEATLVEQTRGAKVISFKKRRRKHSSARKRGHRQYVTRVRIGKILAKSTGAATTPKEAKKTAPAKKPTTTSKTKKATVAKNQPAKSSKSDEASTRPANLLEAAKGKACDLKQISGVGPKLEKLLHDNGIYHFWQIAEWSAQEVDSIDNLLFLKGRIARDGWVEQASRLAKETKVKK